MMEGDQTECSDQTNIERYLIRGWEKHVFSFGVIPTRKKGLKIVLDNYQQLMYSAWRVFVKSGIMKCKKKEEKKFKFVIHSELVSSPRRCVFVKFFYSLSTKDGNEVLMRRGRKCCVYEGKYYKYHINNIIPSKRRMVLNVTVVSETSDKTGLVDLMKTMQEIQSSASQVSPHAPQQGSDNVDIKPEIDSDGNIVVHPLDGRGQTDDQSISRQKMLQAFSEHDRVWEKFTFNFIVECTGENPCVKLKKKETSSALCKWDITGNAGNFGDDIVLSVDTKLCESPRKVSFVKFLLNLSTEQGRTLQNFEVKRCYNVFERHRCQLKSIPRDNSNILLNVIIMSDTFDNGEANQSITSNNLMIDLVDSDDDEVMIMASSSEESSMKEVQISAVRIKKENDETGFPMNSPGSSYGNNWVPHHQDYISSWETCIYNYSLVSEEQQHSIRCLKHCYKPSDASNKWHVSASVCNEENTDHDTVCISFKFKLESSMMEKVLVKLIFFVNTIDGIKEFREKCCLNVKDRLEHCLREIHFSPENSSLEVVILSEAPKDSFNSSISFCNSENILSEAVLASEDQQSAVSSTVILETKEVKLIADVSKLVEISPVIKDILDHSSTEGKKTEFKMTEFSSVTICQLLAYVNGSDCLELGLNSSTELLKLSFRYGIESLKTDCESYLVSILNESNAMTLLLLADNYSASKLKHKAVRFICKNSEIFAQNSQYNELNERPDLLKEILIGVTSKSATKRKKSTERKTSKKKDKKDNFMRNLEEEYMTSEQNEDDPVI